MAYVVLYFVMTNAVGYLPPLDVRPTDSIIQCGIVGAIVGLQINKLENPTIALWPDPHLVDKHCEVDIAATVASLQNGEYHLATTEIGKDYTFGTPVESYIGIDPHTSVYFLKSDFPMSAIPRPLNVRTREGY